VKRWKQFFPLLRCPGCRRWIRLVGHSEFRLSIASASQVREAMPDREVMADEAAGD